MKSILLSVWYGLVIAFKRFPTWLLYPIAYLAKDWVYGNDVIQNYTIPKGVQENNLKWLLWLFLDDDQPNGYPLWYAKELLGYEPKTAWDKFRCAYTWSAWRNPMYNVNYNYLSKPSSIVSNKVVFGNYSWNRKLRASNGDDGAQFVWMTRADDRTTYLFSAASQNLLWLGIPFTAYYGFNADTNGRFTIAFKFK
ncbi:MAG: hypothetical protein OQL19_18335 [Gammaproteobacteria bacterium]|nr:hypothetical protein [Gammaproteobacteria bacterium]